MRTRPSNFEPCCIYCNEDHNPDIQCRNMPESPRFQLPERKPVQSERPARREAVTDASGKVIAWRRTG